MMSTKGSSSSIERFTLIGARFEDSQRSEESCTSGACQRVSGTKQKEKMHEDSCPVRNIFNTWAFLIGTSSLKWQSV